MRPALIEKDRGWRGASARAAAATSVPGNGHLCSNPAELAEALQRLTGQIELILPDEISGLGLSMGRSSDEERETGDQARNRSMRRQLPRLGSVGVRARLHNSKLRLWKESATPLWVGQGSPSYARRSRRSSS